MKKISLYLSSYVPLYIILVLKEIIIKAEKKINNVGLIGIMDIKLFNNFDDVAICFFILLSIISIAMLAITIRNSKKMVLKDYKILEIENKTAEYYFEYVGLYFLPCVGLSIGSYVDCFILTSIIVTLGIVYIKNDLLYINPVLIIFGYNVFSVELVVAGSERGIKTNKIIITDCESFKKLIDKEVKIIVADTKYTMLFKEAQIKIED